MDPRLQTDYLYQGSYEEPMAKIILVCDDCDSDIHDGEDYYSIDGHNICEDCISDYKKEVTTSKKGE